jgi:putative FmdB family regulatory protein
MPLYEYRCERCDHAFEALVFDGEKVECPECSSRAVNKQLSLPAKPQSGGSALLVSGCGEGPPCGAPWCKRQG